MDIDRRRALAMGAAALAAGCGGAGPASAQGGWSARAAAPWAAQEIYAAAWNGRIVFAGGLTIGPDGFTILDRTGIYDPAADAWSEGPRLPQPRHHPMIVAAGERVFAFGGYGAGEGGTWSSRTEAWVFDGQGWTASTPMPAPQAETVGAMLEGRIHLVGGRAPAGGRNADWEDQADIDLHQVFDPAAGTWTTAAPVPAARNSAAGAVIDGALYLVGGRTVRGGNTGRLDRYDPKADRWETLRPMPQGAGGLAAAAAGGKLYAFGGEWFAPGGGGVYAETWAYDPAADAWSPAAPMRTPRHGLAAAAVGGKVYALLGGEIVSGGRASRVVEAFDPGA